ncbi:MAG: 7TM diverse intracellular signaling domain-containing protein [Bacteroidota bacterium]
MGKILFVFLLSVSCFVSAQKIVTLGQDVTAEVNEELFILSNPETISGPADAYRQFKSDNYRMFSESENSLNTDSGTYWIGLRLSIDSTGIENFIAEISSIDSVNIYVFSDDSLLYTSFICKNISVDNRQIKIAFTQFVPLILNSKKEILLILKLSFFKENNFLNEFKIKFYETHSFYKLRINERYFQGIFIGIIIIMILFNLFLFLSVKHKSYLYYILMLVGCGAIWINNYKFHYEYLLSGHPLNTVNDIGMLISSFFGIFLILFTQNFLETKIRHKKWHFVFNLVIVLLILLPVANYFFHQFYNIFRSISFSSGLIVFLMIFILSIISLRKKFRPARYFFLANVLFCIGAIIFILGALGIIGINWFVINSMQAGTIFQIALFSFALADRINILKHENEASQLKIIKQLEENEALKDKVNRELEQKVKERTIEISQQKEEIETQRDEIEAQRDMVIRQKDQIEEIHEELTSSIRYAKRIQSAVLPSSDQMAEILGDHFVFFAPRDIVSGDFYWATKLKKWIIFCVADCTGHGVPGAFMSMLGITFLNEIVRKEEITNAADVLNQLRKSVVASLKQQGRSMEQKDGMDISFCVIDTKTNILQFAGANNQIYLVRRQQSEVAVGSEMHNLQTTTADYRLIEIKGDKMPIAIHERMTPFTLHEHELEKEDSLYLVTDGFSDQFGGTEKKKYSRKSLKNLILKHCDKPMFVQKQIFSKTLSEWMGDSPQIDDITLMGIKL